MVRFKSAKTNKFFDPIIKFFLLSSIAVQIINILENVLKRNIINLLKVQLKLLVLFGFDTAVIDYTIFKIGIQFFFILLFGIFLEIYIQHHKKISSKQHVKLRYIILAQLVLLFAYFWFFVKPHPVDVTITSAERGPGVTLEDEQLLVQQYEGQLNKSPEFLNPNEFDSSYKNDIFSDSSSINDKVQFSEGEIVVIPIIIKDSTNNNFNWHQIVVPKDTSLLVFGKRHLEDSTCIELYELFPKFIFDGPKLLIKYLDARNSAAMGKFSTAMDQFDYLLDMLKDKLIKNDFRILSQDEIEKTIAEVYYWQGQYYYIQSLRLSNTEYREDAIFLMQRAIEFDPSDPKYRIFCAHYLDEKIDWELFKSLKAKYPNHSPREKIKYDRYIEISNCILSHYKRSKEAYELQKKLRVMLRNIYMHLKIIGYVN